MSAPGGNRSSPRSRTRSIRRWLWPVLLGWSAATCAQTAETGLDSPSDAVRANAIEAVVKERAVLPPARVDRLLHDTSRLVRVSIAAYPFLSEAQLRSVVDSGDLLGLQVMLSARRDPLPPAIVASAIALRKGEVDRIVAGEPAIALTPADVNVLASRKDPLVAVLLAQNHGVGSVRESMQALIATGNAADLEQAIAHLPIVPTEVVDDLLAQAPLASRRYLSMQGRFTPTPAQVAKVIDDPDAQVRIGLLRRKDIDLPPDVVNAHLFDPDENVAFWFVQRKEFKPTPEQIEFALTGPRPLLRRQFVRDGRVPLSPAQVERGLTDPDSTTRQQLVRRSTIALTDAQLDRCIVDGDFSVRYACIQRPDFPMTQGRFEVLVQDSNPNMMSIFTEAARPTRRDLTPFVMATLATATHAVRLAMARNRSMNFDAAQIEAGAKNDDPDVRAAFAAMQRRAAHP